MKVSEILVRQGIADFHAAAWCGKVGRLRDKIEKSEEPSAAQLRAAHALEFLAWKIEQLEAIAISSSAPPRSGGD
jgi:hypothetical protein